MREVCDWLASEGYLACCPDLFWRIEPGIQITDKSKAEWDRAFELFGLFDVDQGIEDLKASLSQLRAHPSGSGRIGTVGYCLGGKLAYLMATRSKVDCSIAYYGVGLDELLDEAENIAKPLLLHVAAKDAFVPPEAQEKITARLADNPLVTLHRYEDQDHAFARPGGDNYDRAAADLANRRSLDCLKKELGP